MGTPYLLKNHILKDDSGCITSPLEVGHGMIINEKGDFSALSLNT